MLCLARRVGCLKNIIKHHLEAVSSETFKSCLLEQDSAKKYQNNLTAGFQGAGRKKMNADDFLLDMAGKVRLSALLLGQWWSGLMKARQMTSDHLCALTVENGILPPAHHLFFHPVPRRAPQHAARRIRH